MLLYYLYDDESVKCEEMLHLEVHHVKGKSLQLN